MSVDNNKTNGGDNSSITYSSTRGGQKSLSFRTVVLQGLAHDGGLFVPDTIPKVTNTELKEWRKLSFIDLSIAIISKFVKDDEVPYKDLFTIITKSYSNSFRHPDVTPIQSIGGHYLLELFHGPTFAFKDVALQLLGNFFEYFLENDNNNNGTSAQKFMTILGATSGDTGSAAIAGLRGKKNVNCIILYPDGKVSPIQECQMTTIPDPNIHCVAVCDNATFDDCQDYVKACFNDITFRNKMKLGAINSINWLRVLAQTTYYFWSYLRITDIHPNMKEVHYSVPTGNFGDILAGYYSKCMGLPIGKLIVATNENDILYRFFTKGQYYRENAIETISPSMDICVSSNFERYLYHLCNNNAQQVNEWMIEFNKTSKLTISDILLRQAQMDFDTARCDTKQALDIMKLYYEQYNEYLLCPHTACGVSAIHQLSLVSDNTICLATAHHGKFPEATSKAIYPIVPSCPKELDDLKVLPKRRTVLNKDLHIIQQFVEECVFGNNNKDKHHDWEKMGKTVLTVTAIVGVVAIMTQMIFKKR